MQTISSILALPLRYARILTPLLGSTALLLLSAPEIAAQGWPQYAGNDHHTARAHVAVQPMQRILWSTPVDQNPPYNNGELFIHYGTPLISNNNTVIVTVRTSSNGFQLEGHCAYCGQLKWTQPTDYQLPPHAGWIPPCGSALAPDGTLYTPAANGTILQISGIDTSSVSVTRIAFYGIDNYNASPGDYSNVYINTPITRDSTGNLYFGFLVTGQNATGNDNHLQSGIACIPANGQGSWVAAATAAGDSNITNVVYNCTPALSNSGNLLYVAVSNSNGSGLGSGYLLALDSTTLATMGKAALMDVKNTTSWANLEDSGTASPTVGPDGDVYFGVLETPWYSNNDRGWLLHFDKLLTKEKIPGAFGWDDTASIVPASAVPSYTGRSSYLVLTKYNNYLGVGTGDGNNRVAILDPNKMMDDPVSGACVMQEVITVKGVTPDGSSTTAVREWCINSAAVDPITRCAVINSEDGTVYRWDFTTNSLSAKVPLTSATGEAYTPTIVGPDGIAYAINNATLFAVGPDVVNVSRLISVSRGKLTLNTATGDYTQHITLKNVSDCNITGPVSLALDSLSSNAQLLNATGTTSATTPAGSPYIDVSSGDLAVGAKLTVTLTFSDSDGNPITYKTRVLAGTGPR